MRDNVKYCVYMHTTPSGKRYIGITARPPEKRWGHGTGYKENSHFWNAIQKYSWEGIKHEVLASGLSKEDACQMEQKLIAEWGTHDPHKGYNLTKGGEHFEFNAETIERLKKPHTISEQGMEILRENGRVNANKYLKGRRTSREEIEKMRASKIGRKASPEARAHQSVSMKKHWAEAGGFSLEHREKLSKALKGRTYSDETLSRMKAAKTPEKNPRSRAVKQILDGREVSTYCSAREAMRQTGIDYTSIVRVCNGTKLKHAGGYEWRYA